MKEIGLRLKQKREDNGVSLEEAATDLQMRVSQLESIEDGSREEEYKNGYFKMDTPAFTHKKTFDGTIWYNSTTIKLTEY